APALEDAPHHADRACARTDPTDRTDRTDRTRARELLENGDWRHFPVGHSRPPHPLPSPPYLLGGKGCGGKWWLSPFSCARKGFFAALRMTQGVGTGGVEPRAGGAMRFLVALEMTQRRNDAGQGRQPDGWAAFHS